MMDGETATQEAHSTTTGAEDKCGGTCKTEESIMTLPDAGRYGLKGI